jgi:ribosome-binding factor A
MKTSRRTLKLASLLQAEIARLFIEEVSDPRIKGITVTEVQVTPDMREARIYYEDSLSIKDKGKGLQKVIPFLRKKIADNLQLKYVPQITFFEDGHASQIKRLFQIMDEVTTTQPVTEEETEEQVSEK